MNKQKELLNEISVQIDIGAALLDDFYKLRAKYEYDKPLDCFEYTSIPAALMAFPIQKKRWTQWELINRFKSIFQGSEQPADPICIGPNHKSEPGMSKAEMDELVKEQLSQQPAEPRATCKWVLHENGHDYKSACGIGSSDIPLAFTYCPNCGRPIELKEGE